MDSESKVILYHTDVRWLSRGKVLSRLVKLKNEVQLFLLNHKGTLAEGFNDESWLLKFCYLADIFEALNESNLQLQGKNVKTPEIK